MYVHEVEARFGLDLSEISNDGGTEKRFDFVLTTGDMVYGIEVNFYGSGGSKLNETSRSYKLIAEEAELVDGFTFVWVTDGKGWRSARHNLQETFDSGCNVMNLTELEHGAFKAVHDGVAIEYFLGKM